MAIKFSNISIYANKLRSLYLNYYWPIKRLPLNRFFDGRCQPLDNWKSAYG